MRDPRQTLYLLAAKLRAPMFSLSGPARFAFVGRSFRYFGHGRIFGASIRVGDNCWFEAVTSYRDVAFRPTLDLGSGTSFSSNVHVSAVSEIIFGDGCLVGSNVYIGDHSHGSTQSDWAAARQPPADRPLSDIAPIHIGNRVWIGDGVVILAGARIPDDSIIGANSVVNGKFDRPAVIAGAPARVVKELP